MKRKVCVVTGTRADYGLLFWLMKEIEKNKNLDLQVLVTGMHLSPEFGLTYKEVAKDFIINKKIEMLLSSDTPIGICKSIGLAQISFSETYEELKPDLLILLGDRFEIFAAATAAMISRIPIAHIHGGELTEGLIDDPIRHSITKMSHLHFTCAEEYRRRVIQLGESPEKVFNVGGLGIENIKRLKLLSKSKLEDAINFKLGEKNALVTFHPVTQETSSSKRQFESILKALEYIGPINIIFTKSNGDTDGRIINKLIDNYTLKNKKTSISFKSMGQLLYLSTLKHIDFVIGNSSSGLLEAPTFKIPTINIGDRQKGRIKADSVIDCIPNVTKIIDAIEYSYSQSFKNIVSNVINPYGNGRASKRIVNYLTRANLLNILKKPFYNLSEKR